MGCAPETISVKELSEKITKAVTLLTPLSTRINNVAKEEHTDIWAAVNG